MKKKRQRRQRTRWRDEKGGLARITWNRPAADRDEWRRLEEVFILLMMMMMMMMMMMKRKGTKRVTFLHYTTLNQS